MASPYRYPAAVMRGVAGGAILASLAAVGTAVGFPTAGQATYGAAGRTVPLLALGPAAPPAAPSARPRQPRVRIAQAGDNPFMDFLNGLFGIEQGHQPRRWRAPGALPPRAWPPPDAEPPPPEGPPPPVETYRTMCVRLCDGYYWPVSFATTREMFERDRQACTRSCGTAAVLYYYPNPGGEPADMIDLDGQPYKSLGTAFLYRSTYDASCKCRPHPWEPEAIARHRSYTKPPQMRAAAGGARRGR